MKRFAKREILSEINNGNEEVLVYLARKYFSTARRLLRIRGFRDEQTPKIFSAVLAAVYADLRQQKKEHIDFEAYFLSALNKEIETLKEGNKNSFKFKVHQSTEVASQCVSILDEQAQALLFARVAEQLSFEQIKDRFQFSNAVIAEYEVQKALSQLTGIVKLRMNIAQN
ncbi:MAG: hypothetical protein ABI763_04585 [Bacteroidota bacterium]